MGLRTMLVVAAAALLLAAPAGAFRIQEVLRPLERSPVEALADREPDDELYDRARRCRPGPQPGMTALRRWLERTVAGQSLGIYRCEKWGAGEASLHAESRAIDWNLDVARPADRAEARRLIELLLAPDSLGTPRALARRMGIQEIIWDCSIWTAGSDEFRRYAPCYGRDGRTLRRKVNRSVAHRDHIHLGMTRDGAAGRTTFWRR